MSYTHRILLTGANGYIASHILSQLMTSNEHSVRAVVRSQEKVDAIKKLYPNSPSSQLDFAIVPDISIPGAFDQALKSNTPFDIIMHTASPFRFSTATSAQDFLDPAIKGTTEVLEGVQRVARNSVRRVIVTSSYVAVGTFGPGVVPSKVYTEDDWNPITLEQAEAAFAAGIKGPAYLASKTFAERAAWEFKETHGAEVRWDLVVLNPPIVYGPLTHLISNMEDLGESAARIYKGFFADKTPGDALIGDELPLYVDVRDLATAHLRAMVAPEAANKRFNVCAGDIRSQEIADILRKEVPGSAGRVPKGEPGKDTKPHDAVRLNSSRAEKILGMQWRTKVETFKDMGRQFMEMEEGKY
ncbi:NAD(P)-binding protein [Phaeosphaeriaceae sp. SRC1lsM3a]|nr:NAD(P)-binding protein [Stagonospora sp. SRC1lsM3a]